MGIWERYSGGGDSEVGKSWYDWMEEEKGSICKKGEAEKECRDFLNIWMIETMYHS